MVLLSNEISGEMYLPYERSVLAGTATPRRNLCLFSFMRHCADSYPCVLPTKPRDEEWLNSNTDDVRVASGASCQVMVGYGQA